MAGEETEAAASVVEDGIDEVHDFRITCGAPSCDGRLDPSRTDAVGNEYHHPDGKKNKQGFFPVVVLEKDVDEHDDEERP